ncbi:hypothetical protein GH975_11775 [Litorivicinus lipolyticus]|uniref:Transporter, CPA2 family n=1 Tax=Litorivicinus lipolyticus TaxID=418701 RepID=A0A5Q2QJF0_9GAMM|nr:cation:proton antiporter [Litorivicinus lipolyticus]QGG81205.1 hypothetical protein GH975_11775 [Litorivicinus lipolyticus]
MTEGSLLSLWIAGALIAGTLVRMAQLPPLVGFLLAGVIGVQLGAPTPHTSFELMSELGVELLLFTIGLKIRLPELLRPLILTTGLAHIGLFSLVMMPVVVWFQPGNPVAWILAIGLTFSSTVMAAKVLEARRETRAFHGRLTVGLLVMQDVVAVVLLGVLAGEAPSYWAFGLLALPLLRPVLMGWLDRLGDGELVVLGGSVLALVVGGALFRFLGLSGELGALVMGTLLAGHVRAKQLADNLWAFRELMLVGFFLLVGTQVTLDWQVLQLVALLTLLLPVKAALWVLVLCRAKLRSYTGFLASANLFTYSEFALVVASGALAAGLIDDRWMGALALSVVVSFILAAPLARYAHRLFEQWEAPLSKLQRAEQHPDDQPISIGSAKVLVMGMGRIGTGAYLYLRERGVSVVGLDADPIKVGPHVKNGRRVLFADAEDPALWRTLNLDGVQMVLLAMPDANAQEHCTLQLRKLGFPGLVVSGTRRKAAIAAIEAAGCDMVFDVADAAGVGLGERAWEQLGKPS